MEEEPGVATPQGGKRRSQRPPEPLTHNMDKRALQEAYFNAGLLRPELTRQHRSRSGKGTKSTGRGAPQGKETRMAREQEQAQDGPPVVRGTQSRIVESEEMTIVQKHAAAGVTALVVGILLQFSWKGIQRWLG